MFSNINFVNNKCNDIVAFIIHEINLKRNTCILSLLKPHKGVTNIRKDNLLSKAVY